MSDRLSKLSSTLFLQLSSLTKQRRFFIERERNDHRLEEGEVFVDVRFHFESISVDQCSKSTDSSSSIYSSTSREKSDKESSHRLVFKAIELVAEEQITEQHPHKRRSTSQRSFQIKANEIRRGHRKSFGENESFSLDPGVKAATSG